MYETNTNETTRACIRKINSIPRFENEVAKLFRTN